MARTAVEAALVVVGLLLTASPAQAQAPAGAGQWLAAAPKKDKGADSESADKDAEAEGDKDKDKDKKQEAKPSEGESGAEEGKASKSDKEEPASDTADPIAEAPHKTSRWLGLRARGVVIPSFMFGLFGAKGGETVLSPQVGAEFGIRRNDFEYDLWLTYARYAIGDTAFKASNDPETAYEIVSAALNTMTIGADFLWSHKFNSRVQFVYGIGAGLSFVFGTLHRTQAYPGAGGGWQKCAGPDNPTSPTAPRSGSTLYCDNDNDHYNGYKEPSWANGGQKPLIIPWIAPFMVGVRFKPHAKVALRAELGVAMPGPFFFGLSGQYGL